MWRYYLVPVATVQDGLTLRRAPAFVKSRVTPLGLDVAWGAIPWGRDGHFLLGAEVDTSQHLDLSARANVLSLPIDDGTALSTADQAAAKAFCTGIGMPSAWITGTESGKSLAKALTGIGLVIQRFRGRTDMTLADKLSLRVRELTAAQRDHLLAVADDMGYDRGSITSNSRIGDLLIAWGRQWASRDIFVAGRVL